MALFLQNLETGKGILKMLLRLLCQLHCPCSVPEHFRQFIACIRISLYGGCMVQRKRMLQISFHALSFCIQTGKSILGILMAFLSCQIQPESSSFITLICAKAGKIHFPDPVLQIRLFSLWQFLFSREKGIQRFQVPFLRCIRVCLHSKTVRPHPAQVIHGKRISLLCFLTKQTHSFLKILGNFFTSVQIAAGQFVLSAPFCFYRRFLYSLRRVRNIRFRF